MQHNVNPLLIAHYSSNCYKQEFCLTANTVLSLHVRASVLFFDNKTWTIKTCIVVGENCHLQYEHTSTLVAMCILYNYFMYVYLVYLCITCIYDK